MFELSTFNFEKHELRTALINNEPFFIAKDVTDILGLSNGRDAVSRLDDDEKAAVGISDTSSNGVTQKREVTAINESGLYSLVMTSNKPEAKKFKKWVTSEVLPSIRKTGGYLAPTVDFSDPDNIMKVLENWKADREKLIAANKQIEIQKPKALFADAVTTSTNCILIGELAKILKQNGIDIGQNRLFEKLRLDGYLSRRKGSDFNNPTQYSMELGLFKIKETAITHSDGHVTISRTTKVTGSGQIYFVNKFLNEQSEAFELLFA